MRHALLIHQQLRQTRQLILQPSSGSCHLLTQQGWGTEGQDNAKFRHLQH
jgi:hypothetical protein